MKEHETILSEKRKKEIAETIIAPFQSMYNRLKRKDDNLYPFIKSDYLEAQLIPCHHLTDLEKEYIFQQDLDCELIDLIQFASKMNAPAADYRRPFVENTPMKTLLSWFVDKKSKHVKQAREEMTKRYPYLDPKDQSAFRLALLQSASKTDHIQAVKYCLDTCSKKENAIIQEIWRQNDDFNLWKVASKVLIRNSTTQFLVEEQRKLFEFSDGRKVSSLYYLLALHLYGNKNFEFNKEWFSVEDYYKLLYHKNLPIIADEWENDIYRAIAEIYIHSSRLSFLPRKAVTSMTNAQLVFPSQREIPSSEEKHWYGATSRTMSLLEMPIIRSLLLYASYAGLKEVVDFLNYAHRVDKAILDQFGTEFRRPIYGEYYISAYEKYHQCLFGETFPAAEVLFELCPEKYRHYFTEIITENENYMNQEFFTEIITEYENYMNQEFFTEIITENENYMDQEFAPL